MKKISTTLIIAQFISAAALAAKPSGQSELDSPKSFFDKVDLNFWGRVKGPGIKNPISDKQPDATGEENAAAPISWYQELTVVYDAGTFDPFIMNKFQINAYKTSPTASLATYLDPRIGFEGGGFKVLDTGIGTIALSYVTLNADLGVSKASRDGGMIVQPAFQFDLDMPINGSKFTLGTSWEYRHSILKNDAAPSLLPPGSLAEATKDGELGVFAHLIYKFNDKYNMRVRYESAYSHLQGSLTEEIITEGSKFRLRFDINTIKSVSIRPWITWNPRNNVQSSALGFDISGNIF